MSDVSRLEKRIEDLEILQLLMKHLSAAPDEHTMLEIILGAMQPYGACGAALTAIHQPDTGEMPDELQVVAFVDERTMPSPVGLRLNAAGHPLLAVWQEGTEKPILVSDVQEDTRVQAYSSYLATSVGARAIASVLLRHHHHWTGILSLHWVQPHAFSPAEVQFLQQIAAILGPVFASRRALLSEQTQRRRVEHIDRINAALIQAEDENALLEAVAGFVRGYQYDQCSLSYFEEDETVTVLRSLQNSAGEAIPLETLPLQRFPNDKFAGTAVALDKPDELLLVEDVPGDSRLQDEVTQETMRAFNVGAYILLVLRLRKRLIGTMSFSWRKPRSFDEDLTVVLTAIRPTLAAVVANRRRALELERMVEERTNELMDTLQQQADFQQRIIEAQRQALEELSTPLIPLMDRILVMPIIGSVDTARARDILRALLAGIGLHRARVVILDITGVALVDSGVAAHLNKTMQAARLKGAYIIITGIADAVAETMVDLGIDWTHVEIQRDLQSGLLSAVGRMGMRLVRQAGG